MNERLRAWGESIRSLREIQGLTQTELAKNLKVNQSTVARWELGLMAPTDSMKERIAGALGSDARVIFQLRRSA